MRVAATMHPRYFLDFLFNHIDADTDGDGGRQQFRPSGEPTFNRFCGFAGYRGVGAEHTAKI